MKRKVLIVDDSNVNRMILNKILSNHYEVIEAENGKEAIKLLYELHESISAVMLDILMPVMDGYEVLSIMRTNENLLHIPVIVMTGSTEDNAEIKALSMGANDYVVKPYNPFAIIHRLGNTIKLRETAAIVNSVKKDALTGIYNKEYFYKKVESVINADPAVKYDIICCDIERFKLVNELFGEKVGDRLLRYIAELFMSSAANIGICGRVGADKFAVLMPHKDSYIAEQFDHMTRSVNSFPITINISLAFGIYFVDDTSVPVSKMCDRALTACNTVKGKYGVFFAYYDNNFRDKLLSEQMILDSMKHALIDRQFVVYYQPKVDLITEKAIGAEALVRWNHPEMGFLSPAQFIPVFERNGFITDLDIYVWKTVCSDLSEWIAAGNDPIPISVNVSRADIHNPQLPDIIMGLVNKYGLEAKYLHLEITETAYTEDSQQLIIAVSRLRELGFIIEMDDFGTGYSSLNMLSELPINILKLDMIFIRKIFDPRKMSILRTIIFLAKELGLPVVAEGVESSEQAQTLREMGCDFAQGYLFDRPLPNSEFRLRLDREQSGFPA